MHIWICRDQRTTWTADRNEAALILSDRRLMITNGGGQTGLG